MGPRPLRRGATWLVLVSPRQSSESGSEKNCQMHPGAGLGMSWHCWGEEALLGYHSQEQQETGKSKSPLPLVPPTGKTEGDPAGKAKTWSAESLSAQHR